MSEDYGSHKDTKDSAILDMIFTVLTKHEETLDKVASRLEAAADTAVMAKEPLSKEKIKSRSLLVEILEDWKEFKERSSSASEFLYEVSTFLSIRAVLPSGRLLKYTEQFLKRDETIYRYISSEPLRSQSDQSEKVLRLNCGLEYSLKLAGSQSDTGSEGITVSVDVKRVKQWLQDQMGVDESKVSAGLIAI
ncbi:MAG: hypothetical protein HY619_07805 [Thaumarchaeota archaeon]|nr:hypothetical protein [Nitrososphaerota archaeon]